MMLQINFKSGKPVYLQVVDQIKAAAASGALQPGEALPSIRPLAEELRVNRNTIAKAYSELESLGVIETLPGQGLFPERESFAIAKGSPAQAADRGNRPGHRAGAPSASATSRAPRTHP